MNNNETELATSVNGQNVVDDTEMIISDIENEIAAERVSGYGGGEQGPTNTAPGSSGALNDFQVDNVNQAENRPDLPREAKGILKDKQKYAERAQAAEQQNQYLNQQIGVLTQQVNQLTNQMSQNSQPDMRNPLDGLDPETPMTVNDLNQLLDYREHLAEKRKAAQEFEAAQESQKIWSEAGRIGSAMVPDFMDVVNSGGAMLTEFENSQLENITDPVSRAKATYELCQRKLNTGREPGRNIDTMLDDFSDRGNNHFQQPQHNQYQQPRNPQRQRFTGVNTLGADAVERMLDLEDETAIDKVYDRINRGSVQRNNSNNFNPYNNFDMRGGRTFF